VSAIEINLLLDRLEALLVESRPVPFSSNVLIDRDRCFDIINQMRVSIPEEVKKSKRVFQERDRVIAQANEEAERITALAREQAAELTSDHQVLKQTEGKAQVILERAQREAQEIRFGADDYALAVLKELERHLIEQLNTVQNGIVTLDQNPKASEPSTE
jgi:regulator of protease activity HflC (stomatin/prohibitin superfamily)